MGGYGESMSGGWQAEQLCTLVREAMASRE